jgi:hypothetical protein
VLNEYMNDHALQIERELRDLAHLRPHYDRPPESGRGRIRRLLRGIALEPARATPDSSGHLRAVSIRPATTSDTHSLRCLAEESERRMPSGLVLVAEVESGLAAALPVEDEYVMTSPWQRTGDLVQLLELRSEQLRAERRANVA